MFVLHPESARGDVQTTSACRTRQHASFVTQFVHVCVYLTYVNGRATVLRHLASSYSALSGEARHMWVGAGVQGMLLAASSAVGRT